MDIEREKFTVTKKDWQIDLEIIYRDIQSTQLPQEKAHFLQCAKSTLDLFSNPNKYEKRLAKHYNIPIDSPSTKKLHTITVINNRKKDFCMGSGGIGGGKIFWTPYTTENPHETNPNEQMLGCGNCFIFSHELHHGIGGNAEFEQFDELSEIYHRIELQSLSSNVIHDIEDRFIGLLWTKDKKSLKPFERVNNNKICAIYTRYPNETLSILKKSRFNDEQFTSLHEKCQ